MPARGLWLAVLSLLLQAPQFRSGVDVVPFDVIVLDKARHPIAGLTAADFRVSEDGPPVRIAGFQAVTIPDRAAAASAGPPPGSYLEQYADPSNGLLLDEK